jgi:chemotaxis receptor (MCP) glutamine deamidase CheD
MATLAESGVIRTVLGSCIAVIVYDPVKLLAGVNHYLLPEPTSKHEQQNRLKYGIYAIPDLVQALIAQGAAPSRLRAEIYGGAAVVNHLAGNFLIGDRNLKMAESYLSRLGIPIVSMDVGGQCGRKIVFYMPGCQTEVYPIQTNATGA